MAGGGDQGQAPADGCVGFDLVIGRFRPGDRAGAAEVERGRFGAFAAGQDDGGMGEEGQAADMVDMAMGQDQMGDGGSRSGDRNAEGRPSGGGPDP